jgi:hypothetical protein
MAAWVSYTGLFITTAVIQQVDKVGLGIVFLIPSLIIGVALIPSGLFIGLAVATDVIPPWKK